MSRILIIIGRYLPGFEDGGPIKSIKNLTDSLGDDYDFSILTHDRDRNDTVPYKNIQTNVWHKLGKSNVMYINKRDFRFSLLKNITNNIDLIYVCGVYDNYSIKISILRKLGIIKKPVVIAPMGSFSKGAFDIKKGKKKIFFIATSFFRLYNKVWWSFSTEMESNEALNYIKYKNYFIAENLPTVYPEYRIQRNKNTNSIKIVHFSRISPKKNLHYAINVISNIKNKYKIVFDIYGPIEDYKYWEYCKQNLKLLGKNIEWNYKGKINHDNLYSKLSNYDMFLFPTLGENFGHVIYEALAAGCVTIISNKTPWKDLAKYKCGEIISLDNINSFVESIEKYCEMTSEDFDILSENAYKYAKKKYATNYDNNGYRVLFEQILG